MTLAYLIDLKMIGKKQKVEIRNLYNCITCEPIKIVGNLDSDSVILKNNDWHQDITMWKINHIYTQDDIICIALIDPRGELRDINKKANEYFMRLKKSKLKGGK